jgi:hypothetical protein
MFAVVVFCFGALLAATALSQSPQPLPANYRTILDNPDLLVMRVHYGPHEVVPMHDHSAYPTIYVYLNDSGVIQIDHANNFSVKRPPTHTGAFRVAPGMTERHSITNLSDLLSDFLRVELKLIPPTDLKQVTRGEVPSPLLVGTHAEFTDPALRIDRIVCPPTTSCETAPTSARSLLVAITPLEIQTPKGKRSLHPGDIEWLASNTTRIRLTPAAQALRIALLYPE